MKSKLASYLLLVATVCLAFCTTTVSAIEADTSEHCQGWADSGECDNNAGYMLAHCATSCDRVQKQVLQDAKDLEGISSFFDLQAKDINGNMVNFEEFRGKVTIVVNVASYCGYTESHYHGLVELWSKVKDENVEILGFPCNQFGAQEPESNANILQFAKQKGVQFRMMSKVDVNGPNASLVYKYLKKVAGPSAITWNFATYFVVGPDGTITSHSGVEPMGLLQYSLDLLQGDEL